ncbi:unnamed protein product [Cochlearia groenlandica]
MLGRRVRIVGEKKLIVVQIMGTIGVTNGRPFQYKVEAYTNVNIKHETKVVPSEGDPEFDEELVIKLDKDVPTEFLYVDVFKTNSTGTYLVGKGATLLPTTKNIKIYREVKLYDDCKEAGVLQLSFQLIGLEILGYGPSHA